MAFEQKRNDAQETILRAQQEWQEYEEMGQQEEANKKNVRAMSQGEQGKRVVVEGLIRIGTDAAISARMI